MGSLRTHFTAGSHKQVPPAGNSVGLAEGYRAIEVLPKAGLRYVVEVASAMSKSKTVADRAPVAAYTGTRVRGKLLMLR